MAKVYAFPVKQQLTQEIEDCLQEIAESYVKLLNYALTVLSSEHPDNAELKEIMELFELTYAKDVVKAINKLEP